MAELTLEQKRAVALARARLRIQSSTQTQQPPQQAPQEAIGGPITPQGERLMVGNAPLKPTLEDFPSMGDIKDVTNRMLALPEVAADVAGEAFNAPAESGPGQILRQHSPLSGILGPEAATAVKTGILAIPMLLGFRGRGSQAAKEGAEELTATPPKSLVSDSEAIIAGGDKLTRRLFENADSIIGAETSIAAPRTLGVIDDILGDASLKISRTNRKYLEGLRDNVLSGQPTFGQLDNIITAGIQTKKTFPQIQKVLNAVSDDLDEFTKAAHGFSWADEMSLARGMSALFKPRANLERTLGQHGEAIFKFRDSNPQAFQEVIGEWVSRQLKGAISTTPTGGSQFNVARFARFVNENEAGLRSLLGDEMVEVWKAAPRALNAGGFFRRGAESALAVKTGGLSNLFTKNLGLADEIAAGLADPNSGIFKSIASFSRGGQIGAPQRGLGPASTAFLGAQ